MSADGTSSSVEGVRAYLEDALESLGNRNWTAAVATAAEALAISDAVGFQTVALDILASGHLGLGNLEPASIAAVEALRLGSSDGVPVLLSIADAHADAGDSGRCVALLEAAHVASPTDLRLVTALALRCQRGGNYPGAIGWCEKLDQLDPGGAPARRPALDGLRETVARNQRTRDLLGGIGARVGAIAGWRVVSGPFAGQALAQDCDFGWVAALLGCYEMELHGAIEQVIASAPRRVINVGCSGGYYAIGFARRLPGSEVHAYDIDASARAACAQAASRNGVDDRVLVKEACTPEELQAVAGPDAVVFSDCEGYELVLLDPAAVPALERTTIIVELHDIWVPNLAERLIGRFLRTHDILRIAMLPRDGRLVPLLGEAGLSPTEVELAISDFRPPGMTWAFMVPRPP